MARHQRRWPQGAVDVVCCAIRAALALLLLCGGAGAFRVGQPGGSHGGGGSGGGGGGGGGDGGSGAFGGSRNVGFIAAEEAARDFVAHFFAKDNLGIIFSAELRVTGFYKDRESGKMLPAEESGMIRVGDRILSINDAPITTLQELKAAVASAEVPVHIKFRPPAGNKDDDRHQKTCSDFRFNITIYSSVMPRIDLTTDEFIVVDAEIDALTPGDKLVAVAGTSVRGLNFSTVKRKIDQLFVQEVLRCQKTHCQVEKVADYLAAKILTFEPVLPSYRQSYTVFDMGTNCAEDDAECHTARQQQVQQQRRRHQQTSGGGVADATAVSLTSNPTAQHPARTLLQSVGNLQEATLKLFRRATDGATPIGTGIVTGTAYSSIFPCGEFPVRRARPVYACAPLQAPHGGEFVLVRSGSCSAYDKAMNVQYAGGRGILLLDETLTKKNARDLSTHPLSVATMKLDSTLTRFFLNLADGITEGNVTAQLITPRCSSDVSPPPL